jgi:hypothetical protein
VAKEKKEQQALKDQRYHELEKKHDANSPNKSPRPRGKREEKKKKKTKSTKKKLLDDFEKSGPVGGGVARGPTGSSSGSEEEEKPDVEEPNEDEGLHGDDKESSRLKVG